MSDLARIEGRVCRVLRHDIDTDQIIPARFLKATSKQGIGEGLFADWANEPGFPTRDPEYAGAPILLAGVNFGCGSSREHAAWALVQNGYRVVIARSFADIFRQNALKNGVVPVALDEPDHAALVSFLAGEPTATVRVELVAGKAFFGAHAAAFDLEPFAKKCLLEGVDELGYILARLHLIQAWEATFEGGR